MAHNPPSSSSFSSSSSVIPHSSSNSYVQIVDKKLRVIRKKKAKLEGIQAAVDAGKKINADQEASLKKKDAIIQVNDHLVEIIDLLNEHAKNDERLHNQRRKEIIRETATVLLSLFYSDDGSEAISRLRESVFNAHGEIGSASKVVEKLIASTSEEVVPGVTFKDAHLLLSTPKPMKVEVVSSSHLVDNDVKGKGRKRNNRQKGKQPADVPAEASAPKPNDSSEHGVSQPDAQKVEEAPAPDAAPQPSAEQHVDVPIVSDQEAAGQELSPQSQREGESNGEKKENGDRPNRERGRGNWRGRQGGRGRGGGDGFKGERGNEGRRGGERGRGRGRGRNDHRGGRGREGQHRQQQSEAQAPQ